MQSGRICMVQTQWQASGMMVAPASRSLSSRSMTPSGARSAIAAASQHVQVSVQSTQFIAHVQGWDVGIHLSMITASCSLSSRSMTPSGAMSAMAAA